MSLRPLLLGVLSLALTACGTTVPLTQQGTIAQQSGLRDTGQVAGGAATSGSAPLAGGNDSGATGLGAGNVGNSQSGGTLPGGAAGTSTGPATGTGQSGSLPTSHTSTKASVEVGILVIDNFDQFSSSFGSGNTLGDGTAQAKAVVANINATGGLGGSRVVPVFGHISATSPNTFTSQLQAACETWTTDHHVIAAINAVLATSANALLAKCLGDKGVPLLTGDIYGVDGQTYAQTPTWFSPSVLNQARLAVPYVTRLRALGHLPTGSKVGVVLYDEASDHRALAALGQALGHLGLRVDASFAVTPQNSTGDASNIAAQTKSAVLQFASKGVTDVLFLNYALASFFMTNAETQAYRPRYGLTSLDQPTSLLVGNAPAAQLRGAVGIGWRPTDDVPQDPPGNPSVTRCVKALKSASVAPASRLEAGSAYGYCDGLFALQAAAALDTSDSTIASRLAALGTTFRSPLGIATRLSTSQHDGASQVRDFAYKPACSCFAYLSTTTSV